ncbi:hypothetical protein MASR2M69_22830 [Bacteroidota bacterium]
MEEPGLKPCRLGVPRCQTLRTGRDRRSMPVLADKEGKLCGYNLRGEELKNKLKEIFGGKF